MAHPDITRNANQFSKRPREKHKALCSNCNNGITIEFNVICLLIKVCNTVQEELSPISAMFLHWVFHILFSGLWQIKANGGFYYFFGAGALSIKLTKSEFSNDRIAEFPFFFFILSRVFFWGE